MNRLDTTIAAHSAMISLADIHLTKIVAIVDARTLLERGAGQLTSAGPCRAVEPATSDHGRFRLPARAGLPNGGGGETGTERVTAA